MPTQFIDLSHIIKHGMVTYKGLPAPLLCDFMSREASRGKYAEGTEFQIGMIEMCSNTGTYIDSPFHRYADGKDLSELPLESIANLDGVLFRFDMREGRAIDASLLQSKDIAGKAVLICTGWSKHFETEQYFEGHPFLTKDAAQYLVEQKALLVGIDSYNIDSIDDGARPVHTILLGNEIPIVEHMTNLELLPDESFTFFAVPAKIKGMGSFPVRAYARVMH